MIMQGLSEGQLLIKELTIASGLIKKPWLIAANVCTSNLGRQSPDGFACCATLFGWLRDTGALVFADLDWDTIDIRMATFSPELATFCAFVVSLWLTGTLFEELFRCRLIGELIIGLVFGNVGHLLPADKTALILAGELGVLGIVFEAGLGTDVGRVLLAGPRAALVALVGTIVPLASGFGFIYGVHHQQSKDIFREAVASGASLASTSIAIAVTMMKQQGILDSPIGTLITTAAMLDDVASLILLGIVSAIGSNTSDTKESPTIHPMIILQPILASIGIIVVGTVASAFVIRMKSRRTSKEIIEHPSLPDEEATGSTDERRTDDPPVISRPVARMWTRTVVFYQKRFDSSARLAGMIVVGLGFSLLAEYIGSSRLLGAFMAGVFFSPFESLQTLYRDNITLKIQDAMSGLFFATIGFVIPLSEMMDPVLLGWGVVYGVIATLSKLATMVVVPSREEGSFKERHRDQWLVGTAMVARGELGLLMVQQAYLQGVMDSSVMVMTTWSILLCTLVGIGGLSLVMRE